MRREDVCVSGEKGLWMDDKDGSFKAQKPESRSKAWKMSNLETFAIFSCKMWKDQPMEASRGIFCPSTALEA